MMGLVVALVGIVAVLAAFGLGLAAIFITVSWAMDFIDRKGW